MVVKMNDSLDLRNRILKMREINNLNVTKQDSLNNNLMSEFESSIKDDNNKERNSDKETLIDQKKKILSNPIQNNSENQIHHKDKTENQNITRTFNDNDAQFLMLANKFNEAVEVILELSEKVEKLERNVSQNSHKPKNNLKRSTFFNFRIFFFLLLIPMIIIGFFEELSFDEKSISLLNIFFISSVLLPIIV